MAIITVFFFLFALTFRFIKIYFLVFPERLLKWNIDSLLHRLQKCNARLMLIRCACAICRWHANKGIGRGNFLFFHLIIPKKNNVFFFFLSLRPEAAQACVSTLRFSLWTPLRHVYRVSRASTRPGDSGASTPACPLLLWDLFQTVRVTIHFEFAVLHKTRGILL